MNTEDIQTKKEHIWKYEVNKKSTFCFGDTFEHCWHSLNQLHEVVTWNGFQLSGVPCLELISGISCLNVFETISCVGH